MNDYTNDINEYDDDEGEEVSLASPWRRIGAWLVDLLPYFIVGIFSGITAIIAGAGTTGFVEQNTAQADMSARPMIIYALVAIIMLINALILSKSGQTIGKRALNIRIIRTNGEPAGFVHACLLRYVAYWAITVAIDAIAQSIGGLIFGFIGGLILALGLWLVSLLTNIIMLFAQRDRRTLWDLLAGTVVIQLPKEK